MKADEVMQTGGAGAAVRHLRDAPPIRGMEIEAPAVFDRPALPEFPIDTLPSWMRAMVEQLSADMEMAPDVAAMLGLSVLSTCCARRLVIEARPRQIEQLCLYTISVLPSGAGKSPVFKRMIRPIRDFEEATQKEFAPRVKVEQAEREVLRQKFADATKDLGKAQDSNAQTEAKVQLEDLAVQLTAREPVLPQIITNDVTSEKLAILLHQHGRMAVLDEEAGIFQNMGGRYSADGGANIEPYLKGHDGGTIRVSRVKREDFIAERCVLTMGITLQPRALRDLGNNETFRGRGLMARFLFALPQSNVGSRLLPETSTLTDATIADYERHVRALMTIPPIDDEPRQISMMPEARTAWFLFMRETEKRRGSDGDLGPLADWASKLDGAIVRIAGLLHCADRPRDPWSEPVDVPTVERAIRIGRYLIDHAKAAHGDFGSDDVTERAQKVTEWLKAKKIHSFKRALLLQAKVAGKGGRRDLDPILEHLIDRGLLVVMEQSPKKGQGRHPGPLYVVANEVLAS